MLDFLLSPFKALYNLNTYLKAIKQNVWKTLLFLVYLLVFFSVLFFAVLAIKTPSLTPFFEGIAEQVAQVVPEIRVKDGRLSANNDEYYEITFDKMFQNIDQDITGVPPQAFDQKIVFDTARTEPVYPTKMQQENIGVLITDTEIYILANGQLEVRKLEINKNENISIDRQYILDHKTEIVQLINKIIVMMAVITTPFVIGFFMVIFLILAIIAVAISQLFVRADVSSGDVCSICCYLLAPVFFFLLITFILPFNIPFLGLICFVICIIYAQLILNKIKFYKKTDEE
ncbi:MAG: DUF1189 family protein [Elusimicrobiaceae bacterium]|nr:DUF1189 family protein [Elusimicrobiaceae bacterium]